MRSLLERRRAGAESRKEVCLAMRLAAHAHEATMVNIIMNLDHRNYHRVQYRKSFVVPSTTSPHASGRRHNSQASCSENFECRSTPYHGSIPITPAGHRRSDRIKQSLHASLTAPLTPQAELRLSGQRASRTRNTKHVFVKIIERVRGVDSS